MQTNEPTNRAYQPRPGTLLNALAGTPGATILSGGRMRPVSEVLAEREAAARKTEADKRAAQNKANADAAELERQATENAARVQAEADARRADQAIVDQAHRDCDAAYDHNVIVLKIRHDKIVGQSGRVMRVYWRRGDATDMALAPAHVQDSIAGCTDERSAAEIVARRVQGNGFEVRAFYHCDGLRELEGPAPSGPQNAPEAPASDPAPDTVVMHGNTYRLGEPTCPTKARFRVEWHQGGIPALSPRTPRVFHVKRVELVADRSTGPDDAIIRDCGRLIRHTDFEVRP